MLPVVPSYLHLHRTCLTNLDPRLSSLASLANRQKVSLGKAVNLRCLPYVSTTLLTALPTSRQFVESQPAHYKAPQSRHFHDTFDTIDTIDTTRTRPIRQKDASMSTPTESTGKFKCTYKDCDMWFESEKYMRRHKKLSDEHDYCALCDMDFDDCDDLAKHKIFRPDKHNLACRICGAEFKSKSGLNRHIELVRRKTRSD